MRKKYTAALLAQMVQHDEALNAQIEANRKDRELARERLALDKQIHKDNLRTRDRVDISLSEYEKLKSDLEIAKSAIQRYENIFKALHIDLSIVDDIVPESFKISTGFDIRRNENTVQIEFNYLYRP
jgi:hypothetical protein